MEAARQLFLASGHCEPGESGVRAEVLASWLRSWRHDVDPDRITARFVGHPASPSLVTACAEEVFDGFFKLNGDAALSLVLVDAAGVVRVRRDGESPLARLGGLHFSRIHIVSELVFQGPQQRHRDPLHASQLVFTSTVDGELDPYLEALRPIADTWWQFCSGYPGSGDGAAFARWVRDHQIDSSLFASAHPEATVPSVLESLTLRERIIDFAVAARGLEPAELQRRFRDELAR